MPLVSVITNSYNSGKYLRANIESMLAQDFDDWEHIVVDCGSTDDSLSVLREMSHERLRVFEVPFCGVSSGRNFGISRARGDIIAILDSDDYAAPDRLRRQLDVLRQRPDVAGVGSGVLELDETSGRRKAHVYGLDSEQIPVMLRAGFNPIPHSSFTFRLSAFRAVGGYSAGIEKSEDFELLLRLSESATLALVPAALVRCTRRSDSHTERHKPKGRTIHFYIALGLILNSVGARAHRLSQPVIEDWLDGVGLGGARALLGTWSLHAMWSKPGALDVRSRIYLLKLTLLYARDMLVCARRKGWRAFPSPDEVALHLAHGERTVVPCGARVGE